MKKIICLMFVILFSLILINPVMAWYDDTGNRSDRWYLNYGLRSYYNFDGTTGVIEDDYTGTYNGTVQGDITRGGSGLIRNSYLINGNDPDYLELNMTILNASFTGNNITISFWINPVEAFKNTYKIFNIEGTTLDNPTINILTHDGGQTQSLGVDGGSTQWYFTNVTVPPVSVWTHYVIQWNDEGWAKIYVNGSLINEDTNSDVQTNVDLSEFTFGDSIRWTVPNYNGSVDEMGIWNRTLNSTEILDLWNEGEGLTYGEGIFIEIDLTFPLNNAVLSTVGSNFTVNYTMSAFSGYNFTNATYYIWNSTEDIFNNTLNFTITGISNSTIGYINDFVLGNYEWNALSCYGNATYSNCSWAEYNYSFTVGATIDSESYNNETYETTEESFYLNISLLEGVILYNAELFYNNTYYTGSFTDLGSNKYSLARTLTAPIVSSPTNISFHWRLSYDSEGSVIQNTTTRIQTVFPLTEINITSVGCPAGFFQSINYTFKDEANISFSNADIKYNFRFGIGELSSKVVNGTFPDINSFVICINESINNYKLGYGEIEYQVDGYVSRRYYMFEGQDLSNSTTAEYILYDLLNGEATSFLFEIKNTYLNPYIDKTIALLRWYAEFNEYRIVEMGKTDEDGNIVMKVKEEDVDYRVAVYELNGSLIKLTDPVRMTCLIDPCTYSLRIIQEVTDYFSIYNIESSLTWDEDNNRFIYIWNDPSQNTQAMRLIVIKESGFQEIIICNTTASGYTGVLTCDIGAYTGVLTAKAYREASPEIIFATLLKTIRTGWNNSIGLFIGFILSLIAAFAAIWSPVAAIIMLLIGLIPSVIFGSITFAIFMAIATLGGIVIHIMKRSK